MRRSFFGAMAGASMLCAALPAFAQPYGSAPQPGYQRYTVIPGVMVDIRGAYPAGSAPAWPVIGQSTNFVRVNVQDVARGRSLGQNMDIALSQEQGRTVLRVQACIADIQGLPIVVTSQPRTLQLSYFRTRPGWNADCRSQNAGPPGSITLSADAGGSVTMDVSLFSASSATRSQFHTTARVSIYNSVTPSVLEARRTQAASEQRAASGQGASITSGEAGAVGLEAWRNRLPGDLVDGQSFFAASGLSERRVRASIRAALGGEITFLPIRTGRAVTLDRRPIGEYLLPFCVTGGAICRQPYDGIDGAVAVWEQGQEIRYYLYFVSEPRATAYFCKIDPQAFDCRPGAMMHPERRTLMSQSRFQDLYESIVDSYRQNQNRLATVQPVPDSNPHLACIAYDRVVRSSWGVNRMGQQVPGTQSSRTVYAMRNACAYAVTLTVQFGDAGGCPATFEEVITSALAGTAPRFTLAPGASREIGPCTGVITAIGKAGAGAAAKKPAHR